MTLFPFSTPDVSQFNKKLGFINEIGELIIDQQYPLHPFSTFNRFGYCVVGEVSREHYYIIDQSNQKLLTIPKDHIIADMKAPDAYGIFSVTHQLDFHDSNAFSPMFHGERTYRGRTKHYAMNLKGEIVFEENIFAGANGFYQLNKPATDRSGDLGGIINHLGEVTVPAQFDSMHWSGTDPYVSVIRDGLSGVIDYHGNEIIPISYPVDGIHQLSYVNDGIAIIYDAHRHECHSFNMLGEKLGQIPITYWSEMFPKACPTHSDGLVLVRKRKGLKAGKSYFLDVHGKNPMKKTWRRQNSFSPAQRVGHFNGGLATYKSNNLFGYIDKSGEVAINAQYGSANPFSNGLAKIYPAKEDIAANRYCYINKHGEFVACNH